MIAYNAKLEKIEYNKKHLIKVGTYGTIFQNPEEKCIKMWNELGNGTLSNKMFQKIKNLQLENYYQLLDMLYANSKDAKQKRNAVGYECQYYEQEEIDILTQPIDYTLDNLSHLYHSNLILTKHNIRCIDLQEENVILNHNGITAIDVDLYTTRHYLSESQLRKQNIYDLEILFIDLYRNAINRYHKNLDTQPVDNILNGLFMIQENQGIQGVTRKLKRHKYPIDYIKDKKDYY